MAVRRRLVAKKAMNAFQRVVDAGRVHIEMGDKPQPDQPGGQHTMGLQMLQQLRTAPVIDINKYDVGLRRPDLQAGYACKPRASRCASAWSCVRRTR